MLKNLLLGVALVGMPVAAMAGTEAFPDNGALHTNYPDFSREVFSRWPFLSGVSCVTEQCRIETTRGEYLIKKGYWHAAEGCFFMMTGAKTYYGVSGRVFTDPRQGLTDSELHASDGSKSFIADRVADLYCPVLP